MKTTILRSLTLSLLSLTALMPLTATRAHADDTDGWYLCGPVRWWWKYVTPNPGEVFADGSVLKQQSITVGAAMRSDRPGYVANRVTYTLINQSRLAYRGGSAFSLAHSANQLPAVQLSRGTLPALRPGQTFEITGVAYTPEKSVGEHQVTLAISK